MIDARIFLTAMALSVVLAGLLVSGHLVLCGVLALRARRYRIAVVSLVGLVCIVALFAAVVVVWFGYAVAHTQKDIGTDLMVLLLTAPPYFLGSMGLWLLARNLHSRLRAGAAW